MRADSGLSSRFAEAARATAAGSKSFYFATRFFPRDLARAAHSVYWFCRHTDDLADEAASDEDGMRNIEAWDRQVRAALDGAPPTHPVLEAFCDTARRFAIPRDYPLELIEGMRMDLARKNYASFAELRLFCYRVASVVGLMMAHVIGFRSPAEGYAVDLGIAMQLTNILRDIGDDLGRGRIYLPADEMASFGYSGEDLRRRVRNSAFQRLMEYQIRRARFFYAAAEPGFELLDPRGRFAVEVAARVYRAILDEIEAPGGDPFHRRAVVPSWKKKWIALECLARPAARYSAGRLAFWRTS